MCSLLSLIIVGLCFFRDISIAQLTPFPDLKPLNDMTYARAHFVTYSSMRFSLVTAVDALLD